MAEVSIEAGLFGKMIFHYLIHMENKVDNWSPTPFSDDDDNPIEELYAYKKDLGQIITAIYGRNKENHEDYSNFPEFKLLDKIQILIEQYEPEESIPDSWERA